MVDLAAFEVVVRDLGDLRVFPPTRRSSLTLSWAALGGDETAIWTESGPEEALWAWLNRLGFGVEVWDPYAMRLWEGYVHGVEVLTGDESVAASLDSMANRVAVAYSYVTYACPSSGSFRIAGTPSGSTLSYDDGAGGDPAGESALAALSSGTGLYNVTQEAQATIQSVDDAANTITLTTSVPAAWADNDYLQYGQEIGRDQTDWADDADSQARYGIKTQVNSTTGMTAAAAEARRDALLDLVKLPRGLYAQRGGGMGQAQVRVTALGWWARTAWRTWHWSHRGELSAQDQAKAILSNRLTFLSSDDGNVADIGHSFTQYRDGYETCQTELLGLARLGDETTGTRALVGVENGKRLFLRTADTSDRYAVRADGVWLNAARQPLEAWRVRPDGYAVAESAMPASVRLLGVLDPSRFFVERVEWRWPDQAPVVTPLGAQDLKSLIEGGVSL